MKNTLLIGLMLGIAPVMASAQAVGGNGLVQGTTPANHVPTSTAANPLPIGGIDDTGKVQSVLISAGAMHVIGSAAAASVYITNQAGTHSLDVDAGGLIGLNNFPTTQAVTQSGAWLDGILGVNGTTIATAINPFPVYLQASSAVIGHVVTDTGSTTVVTGTVTVAGTVTANAGTGTFAVSAAALPLPTGASTATNQTGGGQKTQIVDGSGNVISSTSNSLNVNVSGGTVTATNASVSTTGTAVPGSATLVGGTDGTNLRGISTDTSGRQNVNVIAALPAGTNVIGHVIADSGSTTAVTGNVTAVQPTGTNLHTVIDSGTTTVTQATGTNLHVVVDTAPTTTVTGTVTANLGTLNGAALDASVTGLQVTQGSTTSGQKGGLALGAVTTAAPSYTTAQSSPLSLDTSGNLRIAGTVTASNPSVGTVGSAVPASATLAGGTDGTNLRGQLTDTSGRQVIVGAAAVGAAVAGNPVEVGGTDGTNAQLLGVDSAGNAQVKGGFTEFSGLTAAALNADLLPSKDVSADKWVSVHVLTQATGGVTTFQASNDNSTFVSVALVSVASASGTPATNTASAGLFHGPVAYRYFRCRETSYTSGTATATVELYTVPTVMANIGVIATSVQSGTWTVQPGNTPNTTAWFVNAGLNPSATALNTQSYHITSNTTTTPTASTAYISSISISSEVAGTTSTVTIQDKQGTPLKLVNGFSTTSLTTTPTTINFQTPVKMVSGIDLITAGAVAATVDVWINYYQ